MEARSIALFMRLMKRKELGDALESPEAFLKRLQESTYRPQLRSDDFSPKDFLIILPRRSDLIGPLMVAQSWEGWWLGPRQ